MKQITKYTYEVAPSEKVTMVFTAVSVAENCVTVAVDGTSLDPDPKSPPTFCFPVTKPRGETHFGKIECSFPPGTPDTARFDSRFKGSLGGDFAGPTIKKTDAVHDPDITFNVV